MLVWVLLALIAALAVAIYLCVTGDDLDLVPIATPPTEED